MTSQPDNQDIELLSRYLDGELPAAQARGLETRLHTERDLQRTLVRLQELNQRLRDALTEQAQVPKTISRLLRSGINSRTGKTHTDLDNGRIGPNTSNVLPFPGNGALETARPRTRRPLAIAAGLLATAALALVMNTGLLSKSSPEPSLPGNDRIVSNALEQESSGIAWIALSDGRELRSVLTFPHVDGRWCREYLLRGDKDWRAVACRDSGRWVTQAAGLESYLDLVGAYAPAGAGDAEPVAVFISHHAADIALGLDEEKRLIQNGWPR